MREDVPPLPGENGDVASTARSKSSLGLNPLTSKRAIYHLAE
jgi:hypothetical protein